MKALLACLMCLLLPVAECFALKGGPVYRGNSANVVGTYSGIVQGVFDPTNPRSSNTLGLFSVAVPQSGLASGVVVIFAAGRAFTGTMSGVADPNKSNLRAVIQSTTTTSLILCTSSGTPTSQDVIDRADGNLSASIRGNANVQTSITATLLIGTSLLNATQSVKDPNSCQNVIQTTFSLSLLVDGFKQTNS
ncbi:MAG: hypothetical protein ACR2NX_10825 [Chthoniobacterales bacterium]